MATVRTIANKIRGGLEEDGVLSCCAVKGVMNFPNDSTRRVGSYYDGHVDITKGQICPAVKLALKPEIKECKDSNISMLMATLNTNQLESAKALTELGFVNTGWSVRPRGGEERTKVAVFVKHIKGTTEVGV